MTKAQTYIIGVDAGNTKTTIAVLNTTTGKTRILKGKAGGIHSGDHVTPVANIMHTLTAARITPAQIASMHIGMAGIDSDATLDDVFARFGKHLPKVKFSISNDILIALRSGTDHLPAIALIAGTGTNCMGITDKGTTAQAAGVNYILGDEGGGYWIGRELLRAAVRGADGRGKQTAITKLILKHFKITNIQELAERVFALDDHKRDIAALAHLLTDELVASDSVAKAIASQAVEELVLNVVSVAKKLKLTKHAVDLVVVGSIIHHHAYIQKKFRAAIRAQLPKAHVTLPTCSPEIGALKMAQENLEN